MKKIFLLVMTVVITVSVMADPKDNFKKSGLYLGGSVYGSFNNGNFLNEEDHYKYSSTDIGIRPSVGIFIMDNLSLSSSLSFSSYSWTDYDYNSSTEEYVKYSSGSTSLGLGLYGTYYLTDVGNIIPYAGAGAYISRSDSLDGEYDGEVSESDYSSMYGSFSIEGGALYFLNENVAINANIDLRFSNSKTLTDSSGETYEYADDYNAMEWMDMNTYIWVGISYFFPANSRLVVADL